MYFNWLTDHFVDVMFLDLCFVGDYWVCLQITGGRGQAKEAFCSCKWNECFYKIIHAAVLDLWLSRLLL